MAAERIFLPDDDATAALGARLAGELKPGDLVLLEGGLGVGKTALARTVIRTLAGDPTLEVPSPSCALEQPYETNGGPVLHADLYRLREPARDRRAGPLRPARCDRAGRVAGARARASWRARPCK